MYTLFHNLVICAAIEYISGMRTWLHETPSDDVKRPHMRNKRSTMSMLLEIFKNVAYQNY